MNLLNISSFISRLSLSPAMKEITTRRSISTCPELLFRTSPCLMAEPLKKKRRLDPSILKAREERKKKKIEKQIRKLEKNARQLKPIEECEVSLSLLDEKKQRMRNLPALNEAVLEQRALLSKQWASYKRLQHLNDTKMLDRIQYAQQRALDELRNESEELYQAAIQMDFQLLPFVSDGPYRSPPIENYEAPDGDYLDVSKKWDK